MRYRTFSEADYPAMQALDLTLQRQDPAFDSLPERERDGRLHTSQPALKFYERSEHSFVAEEGDTLAGFILAQPVWQGDRPLVLVRTVSVLPGAPEGDYVVIQYGAVYANRPGVTETVVTAREADGSWKVVTYLIQ